MRKVLTILTAAMALSLMLVGPVGAVASTNSAPSARSGITTVHPRHHARHADWAKVVRESNADGTAAPGTERIGWSRLVRSKNGLRALVFVRGLEPGGVYTFWWVAPHAENPAIPGDVFVARGASRVVGRSGMAFVWMRAHTDQAGIEGFPPLGGAEWHGLTDPLNSVVRVEIAYHGQAEDANGDLSTWRSDFWTGAACPPDTPNPNPAQPHCPVYFAATHMP